MNKNMNHLIGMTLEEASKFAKIRVLREDGKSYMVTMDYRTDRLNVEVTNGKISRIINWG